jgi:hypothetical protein
MFRPLFFEMALPLRSFSKFRNDAFGTLPPT